MHPNQEEEEEDKFSAERVVLALAINTLSRDSGDTYESSNTHAPVSMMGQARPTRCA